MRAVLRNWYVVVPLAWLVDRSPARHLLSRIGLARMIVRLKLRSGATLRCRINEFMVFVDVYVFCDYDVQGLYWQSVRSIVDVGANIGLATTWFAERAPRASIVAIEPGYRALSLLKANLVATKLGERVTVIPLALGDRSRMGYFHDARASGQSTVTFDGSGESVPVTTLDEVLRSTNLARIDLLKLDCEGAEFPILKSADGALLGRIGAIVGEYHASADNDAEDLRALLESHGFQVQLKPHPREASLGRFVARKDQ